jgi:hypothetical protein
MVGHHRNITISGGQMLLRAIVVSLSVLNVISAAIAQPIQRPTLSDAQQSCLRIAHQTGQDKIAPIGVERVCRLDATITPDSVALPGPTGVVGQPAVDDRLMPCKNSN